MAGALGGGGGGGHRDQAAAAPPQVGGQHPGDGAEAPGLGLNAPRALLSPLLAGEQAVDLVALEAAVAHPVPEVEVEPLGGAARRIHPR